MITNEDMNLAKAFKDAFNDLVQVVDLGQEETLPPEIVRRNRLIDIIHKLHVRDDTRVCAIDQVKEALMNGTELDFTAKRDKDVINALYVYADGMSITYERDDKQFVISSKMGNLVVPIDSYNTRTLSSGNEVLRDMLYVDCVKELAGSRDPEKIIEAIRKSASNKDYVSLNAMVVN